MQARLSFTHIGSSPHARRGGMDAGDADGADALLSLAKLANAESSGGMMEDMGDEQHDAYMDNIDTPSLVNRPRRSAKPPPKADVGLSLRSSTSIYIEDITPQHHGSAAVHWGLSWQVLAE